MFDDKAAPGIGTGVANGTGDALELGELMNCVSERKLERIEFDGILAFEVAVAVAETTDV